MRSPDPTTPRVLLVDDTPSNLIALTAVLQPVGADLVEARSGQEALDLVASNWFAAVLIDVQMPAMDGFETAKRIRAMERGREVPIVFLTAIHHDEAYADRGYRAGAADYIIKPFDPAIVRARVKAFVDLFRQRERQRRVRLETALNSAPALVSIFRADDRRCEFGNLALRQMLGGRDVVGASPEELGATPEVIAMLDRVATTGDPVELTEHEISVDGATRVLNITAQPLHDDQGRVDAIVSFAIDMTEAVLSRRSIDQARVKAEHANQVKDEFLAIVSHELRTPLSSILGWAANARAKKPPPDVEHALDIIERNAHSQAHLIDDILDVSRIVAGQLRLEVAPTALTAAIEHTVESLRPAAKAKRVGLVAALDDLGTVDADADRIHQVVWNVVSNAIKFTKAGGHVGVEGSRENDRVVLRVTDDGEGLDPAFAPFVFEPFRQGDASTTRRHGGLGLGLAIAHQIVRAHQGTIQAMSEGKGRGTTIVIELPARAESAGRKRPPLQSVDNEVDVRLDDIHLLVVDDDEDTRLLLGEMFANRGAQVVCVPGAREALAEVRRGRSDVLISDIGMPEIDGFALMQQIRRLPRSEGGSTPAIALTAYSRAEDATRAIAAGFQLHATKPVNPAVLLSSVAALAGKRALP